MSDNHSSDAAVDRILELFENGGGEAYFGEPVTQLEHALQAAALAERAGAPTALVIAALLHDIGHLLSGEPSEDTRQTHDARHEEVGNRWLAHRFGADVTEPVRLHVAAKRYLCAIDSAYAASLSRASTDSLALQGGPMSETEVRGFQVTPWAQEAAALRRWDDEAKIPGLDVPGLSHYRGRIAQLLEAR